MKIKVIIRYLTGPILSIFFSFIVGVLFIWGIGKNPIEVFSKLLLESLGNEYGFGQVLFKATPLIFTGLSVAVAFKAGLFNIGAEGQLAIGAFTSALVGFTFVDLPAVILIPFCIISGFIGGAFWGGIAGYLKARYGSHEVINTIMLNFIAAALVSYLVNSIFNVEATIHTPEISRNAMLPRFDTALGLFNGSPFNFSFFICLICCLLFFYIFQKTPIGYEIKTLGLNKSVAEYARMNIKKLTLYSMIVAGGLAGLVGTNFVMGYKHYYELGFSEGTGYLGIAVALIARNNPFTIIFVSIFFGILEYGGLTINTLVPKEIVTILQGILIFFIIIFTRSSEFKLKFKKVAAGI